MKAMKAKLYQEISYHATRKTKRETKVIARIDGNHLKCFLYHNHYELITFTIIITIVIVSIIVRFT